MELFCQCHATLSALAVLQATHEGFAATSAGCGELGRGGESGQLGFRGLFHWEQRLRFLQVRPMPRLSSPRTPRWTQGEAIRNRIVSYRSLWPCRRSTVKIWYEFSKSAGGLVRFPVSDSGETSKTNWPRQYVRQPRPPLLQVPKVKYVITFTAYVGFLTLYVARAPRAATPNAQRRIREPCS